ncbi:hypothetical protein ACFQZS_19195 [Mucilaginibacter calamicampi]|uniref:Uncharacterized protein n=1 Tax=Mucilaginibacter calamicampi TaxID=1302352 RepID=A0ABW2Z396_9SPHI
MIKIDAITSGDVITYLAADGKYKAFICTSIHNELSSAHYIFALTTYDDNVKPRLENITSSGFYGVINMRNEYFPYSESEVDVMWKMHPEIKPNILGSYGFIIWKKILRVLKTTLKL